jgi:hypothetical protein
MNEENEEQFEDLEASEELVDMQETLEEEPEESNIPDKFKGKSVEDVVTSYLELEKAYGQRANDLGEYRKLADQLLEQQLSNKQAEPEDVLDMDSLLDNPEETVSKLVEKKTKPLVEKLQQYERNSAKEVFEKQHPDYLDVVQSPDFQEWITESPVRQKMFIDADKNYDYDMGSEILNLYKSTTAVRQQQEETQQATKKKKRTQALKNASTETGTAGTPSKKVFSRKQLIHMKINNPAKYEAMSKEITLAYAEGRVKD